MGLLLVGISNWAFASEVEDNALASSMTKLLEHKEDMMNVWCAILIECDDDVWKTIEQPPRDPQYAVLSDGEIFEKMMIDSAIAVDAIDEISLKYEDVNYDYSLDDPQVQEDMEKMMNASTDVLLNFSPVITELEFRGYTFHPMFLKEQKCIQIPHIEFPEIQLPEADETKLELLDWAGKNQHKVTQYNQLAKWTYGNNFENISSTSDKNELKTISKILDDFEESLNNFLQNPNSRNLTNFQNTIKTIHETSEDDDRFLLVELEVTEDRTDVIISVSIESGDYFESQPFKRCVGDDFSELFNGEIERVDATETQISAPITFPTLSESEPPMINPEDAELGVVLDNVAENNSDDNANNDIVQTSQPEKKSPRPDISSPKHQFETGVMSKKVLCEEGFEIIFKSSDNSYACVLPKTAEKLVERGWGISPPQQIVVSDMSCYRTAQEWREHHIRLTITNLDENNFIDEGDFDVYVDDVKIKPVHLEFREKTTDDDDDDGNNKSIQKYYLDIMYEEGFYQDHVEKFRVVKVVGPSNTGWDFWRC